MEYTRIFRGVSSETAAAAIENYEDHMLGITSVKNARDIGGYVTEDGYAVKSGSLLRTGQLNALSGGDERLLYENYHPSYVIDMRSEKEQKNVPDKDIQGAEHIDISFLEDVTSPRVDELDSLIRNCEDSVKRARYLEEYALLIDMGELYVRMVREQKAVDGLRMFFSILLREDAECVIWHCRSGKDRSGLAAALLLYALGADYRTIKLDYCTSNAALYGMAEKYVGCMYDNGYSFEIANRLAGIVGVDGRNMDIAFGEMKKEYGSVQGFLSVLGINENETKKLRQKYLIR